MGRLHTLKLASVDRIELPSEVLETHMLPLHHTETLVGDVGFEPTTPASQTQCTTRLC
jgi:hypothetical protein